MMLREQKPEDQGSLWSEPPHLAPWSAKDGKDPCLCPVCTQWTLSLGLGEESKELKAELDLEAPEEKQKPWPPRPPGTREDL